MKKTILMLILFLSFMLFLTAQGEIISEETYASYYGEAFNGRPTANGEIFDMNAYTAAHKTLPFGTLVEVTSTEPSEKPINQEKTPVKTEETSSRAKDLVKTKEPDFQALTDSTKNKSLVYTPAKASETEGVLWRIQLGSFKREENALRLVIKLRKIGFEPAYEKTETTTRVVLYGIRPHELEKVKKVLELNSFNDYVLRQESW